MKGFAGLIEGALEEQGTAVAVIVHPERGADATIGHANRPFADMVGPGAGALEGVAVDTLQAAVASPTIWPALMKALSAGLPTQEDFLLRPRPANRWLSLRVTFDADDAGVRYAILTVRDITELRRATEREEDSRRLLASIFSRIGAAVLLATAEGAVTMANPAMRHLLGYAAEELRDIKVQDLVAPDYAQAAREARIKQLSDGERYEMRMEAVAKGGMRIPVRLTSMLLRDGDQRLRVVTLIPETAPPAVVLPHAPRLGRDRGELRAVSLAAFRAAFGLDWERIATRAMMVAEHIIRRRLRPEDVLSRSDDHNFIIWFASADQDRNAALLTGAVREIRLRFLTEFGAEAAAHVSAAVVQDEHSGKVLHQAVPHTAPCEPAFWTREWQS